MDYDYDGLLLLLFFMKENDWTVQYIKDKIRWFDKQHFLCTSINLGIEHLTSRACPSC